MSDSLTSEPYRQSPMLQVILQPVHAPAKDNVLRDDARAAVGVDSASTTANAKISPTARLHLAKIFSIPTKPVFLDLHFFGALCHEQRRASQTTLRKHATLANLPVATKSPWPFITSKPSYSQIMTSSGSQASSATGLRNSTLSLQTPKSVEYTCGVSSGKVSATKPTAMSSTRSV